MAIRTVLVSLLLAAAPMAALAGPGCTGHDDTAMSCEAGSIWDSEKQTCVPVTSS